MCAKVAVLFGAIGADSLLISARSIDEFIHTRAEKGLYYDNRKKVSPVGRPPDGGEKRSRRLV